MKLLIAVPAEGSAPLLDFFGALDEKQRQKLLSLFALLLQSPAAVMREPYVKHFCIERYQALYELRAKSKNLVRIIFTLTDDGDILFLTPFIKRHKRNTMQALDRSLDCLTHIRDGSCSTQELSIKFFLNGGMLWSSFFVTLVAKKIVLINLCCRPCFIWGSITIITVWTNMIIINVCKFFYLLIECFLCCKLIQICAFILQGIEITLHRCIVVRISCFAHALCHIYRFAEFGKCFGRIL